jgi:hypothetical protein
MKILNKKFIVSALIGITLLGTTSVDAAERVTFPHLTCYGSSQILYSSSVGVYGQSTTSCDTDIINPAKKITVDGLLKRNGAAYAYDSETQYNSLYVRVQQISPSEYKTGYFELDSYHFVQSSYNTSDMTSWESRWTKTY